MPPLLKEKPDWLKSLPKICPEAAAMIADHGKLSYDDIDRLVIEGKLKPGEMPEQKKPE